MTFAARRQSVLVRTHAAYHAHTLQACRGLCWLWLASVVGQLVSAACICCLVPAVETAAAKPMVTFSYLDLC